MRKRMWLLLALCLWLSASVSAAAAEPDRDMRPLPEEWFEHTIFIGDSIPYVLERQCELSEELQGMQIWSERSLNIRTLAENPFPFWFHGVAYTLPELVGVTGADKLIICLGINDISDFGGLEATMDMLTQICDRVMEANPDLTLILHSCFPMYAPSEIASLNNTLINNFNARQRELCEEKGYVCLDLAEHFRGPDGGVREEYSADSYVHINMEAAALWVEELKNPANYSVDPRSL